MIAYYYNPITREWPMYEGDIRLANPQTIFPVQFQPPEPLVGVEDSPRPDFNPVTHRVEDAEPQQVNGVWIRQWAVVALPPEQVEANQQAARERLMASVVVATQARLDGFARTRNYDGILSLCTYATSSVPKFAAEGQRGVDLRDMTWARLYEIMAEVEAGARPMPTGFAEVEPLLPTLEWPA